MNRLSAPVAFDAKHTMLSQIIPRATIRRLSLYLQVLESLCSEGVEIISSEPLARACDVNASQIRKDLTYFGEFGVRGLGYNVQELIRAIHRSLCIDRQWNYVIIGVSNIGKALLRRREFAVRGFSIVGFFDCDPSEVGKDIYGLEVLPVTRLKEHIQDKNVHIGIISTLPEWAQQAADHLVESSVTGILNYARARVVVPKDVCIEHVDLFHPLYAMAFTLSSDKDGKTAEGKRPLP
ncbi:MAG: redox-sensing transcriptional repressor Rex [Desulfovibrio sp.]|jgi:redox-sensing transcriptional repressor|nr:redox-sensing transcriptional repressor Rex [Desulfovibrio sp.]